jgi:chromosome segregation ATPase
MTENTLLQESNKEDQKKIESLSQEQTRFVQEKDEFEKLLSKTRNFLEQAEKEKHVVGHQLKDVRKSASDDQNLIQSLSNENSSLKDRIGKLKSEKSLFRNKIEELESESLSLKQLNNTNQSTDIQTEEFFPSLPNNPSPYSVCQIRWKPLKYMSIENSIWLKLNDSSRYLQQDQLSLSFSIQCLLRISKKKN